MPGECNAEYDRREYAAVDGARFQSFLTELHRTVLRGYRPFLVQRCGGRLFWVRPLTRAPHAAAFGHWNIPEPVAEALDLAAARGDAVYLALDFEDGGRPLLIPYAAALARAKRYVPRNPALNTPYRQFTMTRADAEYAAAAAGRELACPG